MNDLTPFPDLAKANETLQELFAEVQKWEADLDGGEELKVGAQAVDSLFQTKVSFGNPRNELISLTKERFAELNIELAPIYAIQLENQYDFYAMSLTVNLQPQHGAVFKRLGCRLELGPKGENAPIIQTIFPTNQWHTVINWGGGLKLGLNGNLNWEAGVSTDELAEIEGLGGDIEVNLKNKNEMESFIIIPKYHHDIGRLEIAAGGEGSSECFWQIQTPDLQKSTSVKLNIVFKVPKGTKTLDLYGVAYAVPKMQWLVASLVAVRDSLSNALKRLLRQKSSDKFARGVAETWTLDLPQY
ncbi:MAG: hypothetical protein AAF614_39660 [Chloroflexota bacterium]